MNDILNNIISGISQAINTEFNATENTHEIYAENVSQGLTTPCFSIVHLLTTKTDKLGTRNLRTYSFNVHYFPKDKLNSNRECNTVAERLTRCLEYINILDNTLQGIKISSEINDDVLHFFVTYEMFVQEPKEGEAMQRLIQSVELKEGV